MVTHVHGTNGKTAKRRPPKTPMAEDGWDSLKAALVRNWSALTDDDLEAIKSNLGDLASRLRERYELTLDDARETADNFLYDFGEASSSMYRRARTAATKAAGRMDKVAHRYTWSAVAAALVIGGLAGYICGRDDRRSSSWW